MNIYHIDFENVHNRGFNGINDLSDDDFVVVYYSKNALSIGIELVQRLMAGSFHTEFVKVVETWFPGEHKDAMDFYIVANVFAVNATDINQYIVSNDTSFDCAITAGEQLGIKNISRIQKISDAVPPTVNHSAALKRPTLTQPLEMIEQKHQKVVSSSDSDLLFGVDDDEPNELQFDPDFREELELNRILHSANGGRTHESDWLDELIFTDSMDYERSVQQSKESSCDSDMYSDVQDSKEFLPVFNKGKTAVSQSKAKQPNSNPPIINALLASKKAKECNIPKNVENQAPFYKRPSLPSQPASQSSTQKAESSAEPEQPPEPEQPSELGKLIVSGMGFPTFMPALYLTDSEDFSKNTVKGESKKKQNKLSAQERKKQKKQKRTAALVSFRNILSHYGYNTDECNSISNYVVTILESNKNKPMVYIQNLIIKNYGKQKGNAVVSLLKKEINKQRTILAS